MLSRLKWAWTLRVSGAEQLANGVANPATGPKYAAAAAAAAMRHLWRPCTAAAAPSLSLPSAVEAANDLRSSDCATVSSSAKSPASAASSSAVLVHTEPADVDPVSAAGGQDAAAVRLV